MSSRFIRFDPETIRLLDRCMEKAGKVAAAIDLKEDQKDTQARLASALIEATRLGETDEDRLVEFALRVLPAYREGRVSVP